MTFRVKDTGPLSWNVPIVDAKTGRPTPEFQRRWEQQRANNDQIGRVTLGEGEPTGEASDGEQYFDISTEPFILYVGYEGEWHLAGTASADPTATASDVAVNGTATTFMRSDAAPAVQIGSDTQFGILKVDGTTILAEDGVISSVGGGSGSGGSFFSGTRRTGVGPALPAATTTTLTWSTQDYNEGSWTYASGIFTVPSNVTKIDANLNIQGASVTDQLVITIEVAADGVTYTQVAQGDTTTDGTDSVSVSALGITVVPSVSKVRFRAFSTNAQTLDAISSCSVRAASVLPSTGGWKLVGTSTIGAAVSSVSFTGLTGAEDIFVIVRNITCSVAAQAVLRLSTNNGVSYYNTSGDYVTVTEAGVESNSTGQPFYSSTATAARSGSILVTGTSTLGAPKAMNRALYDAAAGGGVRYFIADNNTAVNAVSVQSSSGNFTGGTIWVFIRQSSETNRSGTAFPSSPATGLRFYRTDRGIEYYYDGTRWLSTQLFTQHLGISDANLPFTSTSGSFQGRSVPPFAGLYDVYLVDLNWWYILVGTGNWTVAFTALGYGNLHTLSGITSTANVNGRVAINLVKTKNEVQYYYYTVTENSGTASLYVNAALSYRLIG